MHRNKYIFSRDLPKLDPGKLPESYFTFETAKNGKVTLTRDVETDRVENLASTSAEAVSQQYVPAPPPPPPEVGKSGKPLTKKEKKAVRFSTDCSDPNEPTLTTAENADSGKGLV